jgi:prenyltransferase beta subunit
MGFNLPFLRNTACLKEVKIAVNGIKCYLDINNNPNTLIANTHVAIGQILDWLKLKINKEEKSQLMNWLISNQRTQGERVIYAYAETDVATQQERLYCRVEILQAGDNGTQQIAAQVTIRSDVWTAPDETESKDQTPAPAFLM